jgi:hypothetical protein
MVYGASSYSDTTGVDGAHSRPRSRRRAAPFWSPGRRLPHRPSKAASMLRQALTTTAGFS